MQDGGFREDLFYRLEVVPISLPPLRERREEIPLPGPALPQPQGPGARALPQGPAPVGGLPAHGPALAGNVRQLENAIERAIVLSVDRPVLTRTDFTFLLERLPDGQEIADALPPMQDFPAFNAQTAAPAPVDLPSEGLDLNQVVSDVEKKLMLQSLQVTRGNKKRAAELLGLKRTTFLEKMKRLDLEDVLPESSEA